jgi:prepilin-type N-terminal cleavage/methylation domain-containing protein
MIRASSRHGAPRQTGTKRNLPCPSPCSRRGFTLLEMCIVLFIIALLFAVSMPALQSAFTEQKIRSDAHELALMVKTAMIRSEEQHRAYVIDVTSTSMSLHPGNTGSKDADDDTSTAATSTSDDDDTAATPVMEDVSVANKFDPPNKLLTPDTRKPNTWVAMPPTTWVFQPGELCPTPRVRLERGDSWVEMSFNALTGNVEDETTYLP